MTEGTSPPSGVPWLIDYPSEEEIREMFNIERSNVNAFADVAAATNEAVVGAIRLALGGAANDESALAMVKQLIEGAPATAASDTESVNLFVEAIRTHGWEVAAKS